MQIADTNEMYIEFDSFKHTEFLVTTAMTEHHFEMWRSKSLPSWQAYAKRFNLGIICFKTDLVSKSSKTYKNGSWQKLLAPQAAKNVANSLKRICLLDTDVLISPFAANVFEAAPDGKFSIVSLINNLPFPEAPMLRRVAYFRHNFYSTSYPLDSFLLGDPFQEFSDLGIKAPADYFCAGVVILDSNHADLLTNWFHSVSRDTKSDAWEQTHMNSWIQNEEHHWLPYEFQAIWKYEMAWNYPFLYGLREDIQSSNVAAKCVKASLWNNHFLHFAGSWFESKAWSLGDESVEELDLHADHFMEFLRQPVSGAKVGKVVPLTE
jgi:hypothetical protein